MSWKGSKHFGKIIDVWAQPYKKSLFARVPEAIPLFKKSKSPSIDWETESKHVNGKECIDMMNEAGVKHVLMSAWNRPNVEVISNETVLSEYCELFPDRFSALISIDLGGDIMSECYKIDQLCREHGDKVKGVRVVPWLWNQPPTYRKYYPIFVKCIENDIAFCTQVGHTGPLCPSDVGRPIPHIDVIALEFPDLRIVGGHIGSPWLSEMISCVWKHENVYLDTSAYLPAYYPKELLQFMDTSVGRGKVLFGTNYPQLMWDKCASQSLTILESTLSDKTMRRFLYENAEQVFRL